MEGQIRLRWTTHHGTVLSVFDALLSSEAFVDVTLACEGQYLRAHKVVLSACSPYFQELLSVDMSKHPILFLKDVKYAELKALIQYMYRGEVNIAHDELASLLAVAEELKIRGLDEVETTNNNNNKSISSDTIILPDVGVTKHNKGLSKSTPNSLPIIPPIIQSSNASHNTNRQSSLDSIPSTTPPPPKKSRADNTRISSQIQRQIDPLLNVDIQPTVMSSSGVSSSSSMYDPLESSSQNASVSHNKSNPIPVKDYGHKEMIEEPWPMYTRGNKKMEEMVEVEIVEVDLDEEQDNPMSGSSGIGDDEGGDGDMTSGLPDDDGEVPSGSGTNEAGSSQGGADRRKEEEKDDDDEEEEEEKEKGYVFKGSRWHCKNCGKNYSYKRGVRRHLLECNRTAPIITCRFCNKPALRKENLTRHEKNCKSRVS